MNRAKSIMSQYLFPAEILDKIKTKKTEKGIIKELSTWNAAVQALCPDAEFVFNKIYNVRRLKANDTCTCGCKMSRNYKPYNMSKVKCEVCKKLFSVLLGTPLQGVHRDSLVKLIQLVIWNYQSRKGYATAKISRFFNWKYDSALILRHRVMQWMGLAMDSLTFDPTKPIQVDEVYPPIPDGLPDDVRRQRGPNSEGVEKVLVMTDGIITKTRVLPEINSSVLYPIFKSTVADGTTIHTDGKNVYNFLNAAGYDHHACNHKQKIYSINGVHVNHAEAYNGIQKTQIKHIHNGISEAHVQEYANDVAFAFSHRFADLYQAMENLYASLPPLTYQPKKSRK